MFLIDHTTVSTYMSEETQETQGTKRITVHIYKDESHFPISTDVSEEEQTKMKHNLLSLEGTMIGVEPTYSENYLFNKYILNIFTRLYDEYFNYSLDNRVIYNIIFH